MANSDGYEPRYRPAKRISDELREHCSIYFSEGQYINALTLMTDIVTAGASHPNCLQIPGVVPIPLHIELVSALLIHPWHTNQANPEEQLALSSKAITLLRNLLEMLGPINANLREAFSFTQQSRSRPRRRLNGTALEGESSSGSDSEDRSDEVQGAFGESGRVRTRARDFWHIVGWAFNCSVKYPGRWKYWKIWLEYMFDVLDADWHEREKQDQAPPQDSGESFAMREECILAMYLEGLEGRTADIKRVVRSIFADGSSDSLRDFGEIFPNETADFQVRLSKKRKRDTPTEDNLGDSDSEEAGEELALPAYQDSSVLNTELTSEVQTSVTEQWLGGPDSVALRQRGMALLSRFTFFLPDLFAPVTDVYDIIYSSVRSLPLPAFSLLFSPAISNQLPEVAFVSLSQIMLYHLLPVSAPEPQRIRQEAGDGLNEEVLERCYLPFPATTLAISDNAKVSILVEGLLRLLARHFPRECNILTLSAAVEEGILARETAAKGARRKKKGATTVDQKRDFMYLTASGQRMRCLLSHLR